MVGIVLFAARPSFDGLFRLIAPLLAIALALLPWADLWAVALSTTLVAIADTTLTIAAVLFVVTAAKGNGVKAALGIGVAEGSLQLGVLAGNLVERTLNETASVEPLGLFTIALGLLVVFSLSWLGYPTNRSSAFETSAARSTILRDKGAVPAVRINEPADGTKARRPASPLASTTIDGICQRLTERTAYQARTRFLRISGARAQPTLHSRGNSCFRTPWPPVKHICKARRALHARNCQLLFK